MTCELCKALTDQEIDKILNIKKVFERPSGHSFTKLILDANMVITPRSYKVKVMTVMVNVSKKKGTSHPMCCWNM